MNNDISIPTFVINLEERQDRWKSIQEEFKGKNEFELRRVNACKHENGAVGLWRSIIKIIQEVADRDDDDVIIICEDDHSFLPYYDRTVFLKHIIEAGNNGGQILYGGVSSFQHLVPISEGLFWVDSCLATQFLVVYRSAFRPILEASFSSTDVADKFLSELLPNKLLIYPFISEQKTFGYSDITPAAPEDLYERMSNKAKDKAKNYLRIIQKYQLIK